MSEPSQFIPPKRRSRAQKQTPPESPKLPKDLDDLWGACGAAATAFNVMQSGSYRANQLNTVNASLMFLQKLHEQSVIHALKHPQAALIPELKLELEKAATDGKTQA